MKSARRKHAKQKRTRRKLLVLRLMALTVARLIVLRLIVPKLLARMLVQTPAQMLEQTAQQRATLPRLVLLSLLPNRTQTQLNLQLQLFSHTNQSLHPQARKRSTS